MLGGELSNYENSLAYAEIRHILSSFLLTYVYELYEKDQDWIMNQRFYLLWERPPFMIKLRKRSR